MRMAGWRVSRELPGTQRASIYQPQLQLSSQSIIIALPRIISIPITSTLTMADTEQKVAEEVTANQVEEVAEEPKVGAVEENMKN